MNAKMAPNKSTEEHPRGRVAGPQSFRQKYHSSLAPIEALALTLSTDACPWIPPLDAATKWPCLHRGPLTHVYFVRLPPSQYVLSARFVST